MLTVEAKVNGTLISYTVIVNKGPVLETDLHQYEYSHFEIQGSKLIRGAILHLRTEGHQKLIGTVMAKVKAEPELLSGLAFSRRAQRAFYRMGITTVDELKQKTEVDLLMLKNVGESTLSEIKGMVKLRAME